MDDGLGLGVVRRHEAVERRGVDLKEAALPALELDALLGQKAALADLLLERDQHRGATRTLDLDALVQCCGDLLPQLGAVCCVRSSTWCQYFGILL